MGNEKGLYEVLKLFDVLNGRVVEAITNGPFVIRGEKIVQELTPGPEPRSPYVFQPGVDSRSCRKWNRVYFNLYGIIPRGCFNCFKVVVRPQTVKDLLKVRKIQKRLGLAAKCGMEQRPELQVKGLYSGYWYCPIDEGLEGARKVHKIVEREILKELGFQTPVILKRACTEMEEAVGPTDQWEYPEIQRKFETQLDEIWEIVEENRTQPEFLKLHIIKGWIEHAWIRRNLDPTAEEFIAEPEVTFRSVKTVTYQEGSGTAKEQPERIGEGSGEEGRPEVQGLSDYI